MRIIILMLLVGTLQAQNYHTFNVPVSVGGATNASSLLTLNSTTQGFLIPRMTTAQRDAIPTPAVGLQIYNTETNTINIFNGTWVALSGGSALPNATVNATLRHDGTNWAVADALKTTTTGIQIATGSNLGTLISGASNTRYTSNTGINTSAIYMSAGTAGSDAFILYQSGGAASNITQYWRGDGSIATRGQLEVGSVDGTDAVNWDTGVRLKVKGRTEILGSSTANTSLSFLTQNSSATNTFSVGDAGRVTIYKDTESSGTQSSARLMVESGDANTNLVLSPKGTGALIVGPHPDGGTAGGNARGLGAVDLQRIRSSSIEVASGVGSTIFGGEFNRASGNYSTCGGYGSVASGNMSFALGRNAVASGNDATAFGRLNTSSGTYSTTFGFQSTAYLFGQAANSSGAFLQNSDNQTSDIRVRNTIANATTELFLDGSSARAVLTPPSGNTSRVWNARLQCVAVTNVQGTGGPAAGSVFSETMDITIKRIGSVTSIVNGTPMQSVSVSDIGMSGADFLVDADDTNEALRVRFQPPTIAAADTQIRAVCTVYLTEIGY